MVQSTRRHTPESRRERILSLVPWGEEDQCWPWTGRINRDGYGITKVRGASSTLIHRLIYEVLVGQIPKGMTIDHTCHRAEECEGGRTCQHRRCCNPAHLKVAGRGPNALRGNSPAGLNSRKTHCGRDHEYTPSNTYWYQGKRQCQKCRHINDQIAIQRRKRKRAARAT